MQLHEFRNTLKKLFFVDRQSWMTDSQWVQCRANPVHFFIRADDETAERLWALIRPGIRGTTDV